MIENNAKRMLPFLKEEDLEELAEAILKSCDETYEGIKLQDLYPFLDDEFLDKLFYECLKQNKEVKKMLPFISDEAFSKAVDGFINGEIQTFDIHYAMPFLDEEDLAKLGRKISENGGEYKGVYFSDLLPFLDDETIKNEFENALKDGRDVTQYFPFVDDDILSKAVDAYMNGNDKINIDSLYPFLDEDDKRR